MLKIKGLLFIALIILIGCTRTYNVTIYNHGDKNKVKIIVSATVPTTLTTDVTTDLDMLE